MLADDFLTSLWKPKVSERVLRALAECSKSDLSLHDLQAICLGILPEIKDDRQTQHQIVVSRIKANDQAGVQWLLADPQRFPACYVHGDQVSNALHVAARQGHVDLLQWLAVDEDAKYWSNIRQTWELCDPSPELLYTAVEGGNLDVVKKVASWFTEAQVKYVKQDVNLTYKAAAAVCQHYLEKKQQGQDVPWQTGKHFEVLAWLTKEGVSWDKRSVGEAAKAGLLELIDWFSADERTFKQRCMQSTFVCTMAIHNPDQDQAIQTLEHLLNRGFPWKPNTRGYAKLTGPDRQAEQAGLCETAASLGRLKVLKWLAKDPDALLPLCKDSFEMRQDGTTRKPVSTGIPLTPWDDGNSPGWIKKVAKKGLAGRDFTERAIELKLPPELMHEVTLAAWCRNTAKEAAKQGFADAAAQYQALAAQVDAEIQAYKETLAWLESPESGYAEHVKQSWTDFYRLRCSLGIVDEQDRRFPCQQQQQAGAGSSAAAAAVGDAGHRVMAPRGRKRGMVPRGLKRCMGAR